MRSFYSVKYAVKKAIKRAAVGVYRKVQKWDMTDGDDRRTYGQNWLLDLEGRATPEKLEQLNGDHFEQVHGYPMHWDAPKTFNEKIMWMSLRYQNPLRIITNKFKMKGYVDSILGPGYTLPVIDWWTDPDDIDFDALPDRFVLKVNNASGHNIFVPDKSRMDERATRERLRRWMHPANNGYYWIFSWAAKFTTPVIFAEEYLIPDSGPGTLYNYKMACFDGVCKYIMGFSMTEAEAGYAPTWYDRDFNRLPFTIGKSKKTAAPPPKPACLPEMIRIAELLARPFPFLRTDLYVTEGRIIVGEITFSFGNGLSRISPASYDREMGEALELPGEMDFDRLVKDDPLPPRQAYLLDGKLPPEVTRQYLARKAFTGLLYWPDLARPRTLNERLLWTALHWDDPLAAVLADRYEAKRYVARTVGEQYVVPDIGVYTDGARIDWDALPERFAARSTANYGRDWHYLVRRKAHDCEGIFRAAVGDWLLPWNTFYHANACLPGRRIQPRILIEELLPDRGEGLAEYRFYCADGQARLACVVREGESCTFLDPESWQALPALAAGLHKRPAVPRPAGLAQMRALCDALTKDMPLVRVDFFETEGRVYVHGLTLDGALFQRLEPPEQDRVLGERFER